MYILFYFTSKYFNVFCFFFILYIWSIYVFLLKQPSFFNEQARNYNKIQTKHQLKSTSNIKTTIRSPRLKIPGNPKHFPSKRRAFPSKREPRQIDARATLNALATCHKSLRTITINKYRHWDVRTIRLARNTFRHPSAEVVWGKVRAGIGNRVQGEFRAIRQPQ